MYSNPRISKLPNLTFIRIKNIQHQPKQDETAKTEKVKTEAGSQKARTNKLNRKTIKTDRITERSENRATLKNNTNQPSGTPTNKG